MLTFTTDDEFLKAKCIRQPRPDILKKPIFGFLKIFAIINLYRVWDKLLQENGA